MKLRLLSDFTDWYDAVFDNDGFPFKRVTTDGPNRKEMFKIFNELELETPLYGNYFDFCITEYLRDSLVVVHKDINAHMGEGKILKNLEDLNEEEKKCFLTRYIPHPINLFNGYKSMSTRYLFIGSRCFKMDYVSENDWRSNCGDTQIINFNPVYPVPEYRDKVNYPMFAIDFVGELPNLQAIDFNIAPGLDRDNLRHYMAPSQIYLEIKNWYKEHGHG